MFDFLKRKKKIDLTDEQIKWNKMWDLWVDNKIESPYKELMTYQSEVNNGGHDQYFTNIENTSNITAEISELEQILPFQINENLQKAYKAYLILEENEDDEKSQEILEKCDDAFYEFEEEINKILEDYSNKI